MASREQGGDKRWRAERFVELSEEEMLNLAPRSRSDQAAEANWLLNKVETKWIQTGLPL